MLVAILRRVGDSIPRRSGELNRIYGLKIKLKLDIAGLLLSICIKLFIKLVLLTVLLDEWFYIPVLILIS